MGWYSSVISRLTFANVLCQMAVWVLVARAATASAAEPWNPILDLFGALPLDARNAIIVRASELREKTGVVLTVVVAPAATLERTLVGIAAGMPEEGRWGLILAPTDNPRPRVVVGPALADICPPELADRIASDYMVPHLQADDLGTACVEGVNAVAILCARAAGIELAGLPRELRFRRPPGKARPLGWIAVLAAGGLLAGLGAWRLVRRRRPASDISSPEATDESPSE